MNDAFAGGQHLVMQPGDTFPDGLAAPAGVADLKSHAVDLIPLGAVVGEVAANLDDYGIHSAYCLGLIKMETSTPAGAPVIFRTLFGGWVAPVRIFAPSGFSGGLPDRPASQVGFFSITSDG